ncbi:MAG: hypothetical protein PHN57_00715 [Candidatus Omnitrophica bacterium]|nr:hypothetical protein [Candidatus Omnitrophota bacterium]
MNIIFILTIILTGISGIAAQVLILRELLIGFLGNELIIGLVIGNWVVLEALGVFVSGKLVDKVKNKLSLFIILEILFSLALPVSIYFCRTFKGPAGIPFGQISGLPVIFAVSFLANSFVGFCHGGLFACACRIYPAGVKDNALGIGKVYSWETCGTIIGGIILSYCLIPFLNSFQIAFIVSAANLLACFGLVKYIENKKLNFAFLPAIFLSLWLFLVFPASYLQEASIKKQWQPNTVLDYRNSVYGNVTVTKSQKQLTFFYNGAPLVTSPYPDITFIEEFANLPLLFHAHPKNILVVSCGAGGLINEILKTAVEKIDYVELDPLIIRMLKEYPSELTKRELTDPRVNVITNTDARFYIKRSEKKYDLVIIGISNPSDLTVNRFFTREFFSLVKYRLGAGGILACYMPGSLTFLSRETINFNFSVINGLRKVYKYVRIIPGDYNILLSCDSKDILNAGTALLWQRLEERKIQTNVLSKPYLDYRLGEQWSDWFAQATKGATANINKDLVPFALYQSEIIWNKQFSLRFARVMEVFEKINLPFVFVLICALTIALFFLIKRNKRNALRIGLTYSIFATGFFAMLANLLIVFSFQVSFGYLYQEIAVLISVFMSWAALGSLAMTKLKLSGARKLNLFIKLESLIIFFTLILSVVLTNLALSGRGGLFIYLILFFISGLLPGLQFPLSASLYLSDKKEAGGAAGTLYSADLFGGWLAGMTGGILLLPVLGLFNTCMLIILLKLSSLALLISSRIFAIES